MKMQPLSRIVFGASAVFFGIIALMWHDPETWQGLARIWRLPFGMVIGVSLMVLQVAGGIAAQHPKTLRFASVVLCVVYLFFSLVCIANIIPAPASYSRYPNFFEQFSLLCGSMALYAAAEPNAARSTAFGKFARVGLGICALSFALTQIVYFRPTVQSVPRWIPPNQMFWAVLTTIAFAVAALALLTNRQARLALRLMTLMLALFGALVWIPLLVAHPKAHTNWSEFALTCLITGATWVIADLRLI